MSVKLFLRPRAALLFIFNFVLGVVWAVSYKWYSPGFMAIHALLASSQLMRVFYLKVERGG